jgi:hypothetical protein
LEPKIIIKKTFLQFVLFTSYTSFYYFYLLLRNETVAWNKEIKLKLSGYSLPNFILFKSEIVAALNLKNEEGNPDVALHLHTGGSNQL